jgi:hypothetical protein
MLRGKKMTQDQIKRLYDYTKFHIGLYAGLMGGLIALIKLGRTGASFFPHQIICSLKVTLFCFTLAGACGGVIGSTISLSQDTLENDGKDGRIGPFSWKWFSAATWAHLEHWFFWIGIIVSVVAVTYYA